MKKLIVFLIALNSMMAFAQSGSRFTVSRSVIAGGGATLSSSSRFQLGSTIGQPLTVTPSSSQFSIREGFWIWPAPIIYGPTNTGNSFVFSMQTEPGKSYTVQYSDLLTNWQFLASISGDGNTKAITNSVPGVSRRFYRLIEQ